MILNGLNRLKNFFFSCAFFVATRLSLSEDEAFFNTLPGLFSSPSKSLNFPFSWFRILIGLKLIFCLVDYLAFYQTLWKLYKTTLKKNNIPLFRKTFYFQLKKRLFSPVLLNLLFVFENLASFWLPVKYFFGIQVLLRKATLVRKSCFPWVESPQFLQKKRSLKKEASHLFFQTRSTGDYISSSGRQWHFKSLLETSSNPFNWFWQGERKKLHRFYFQLCLFPSGNR